MATVGVRYIVNDVDAAIAFYCGQLGFQEEMHPAPSFAMLSRGDLRLVLSAPGGGPGGGQAMPNGTLPEPGGWNRFQLEVDDLDAMVEELRNQARAFAATSSSESAASKPCSRILPGTRSNCSNRPVRRPHSQTPNGREGRRRRRVSLSAALRCALPRSGRERRGERAIRIVVVGVAAASLSSDGRTGGTHLF